MVLNRDTSQTGWSESLIADYYGYTFPHKCDLILTV